MGITFIDSKGNEVDQKGRPVSTRQNRQRQKQAEENIKVSDAVLKRLKEATTVSEVKKVLGISPGKKPMGFASAAKNKQQKSSVEKAVKKALSKKKAQPNVRSGIKTGTPVSRGLGTPKSSPEGRPKLRQKSGAPKKSLRPRLRPGS